MIVSELLSINLKYFRVHIFFQESAFSHETNNPRLGNFAVAANKEIKNRNKC